MSIFDWLFGRRSKQGRIYCATSVEPRFRDEAESAIAENRYVVRGNLTDNRHVLVLRTTPPKAAIISREPSFDGSAPDIIVRAVYDGDAEATAADLAGLG